MYARILPILLFFVLCDADLISSLNENEHEEDPIGASMIDSILQELVQRKDSQRMKSVIDIDRFTNDITAVDGSTESYSLPTVEEPPPHPTSCVSPSECWVIASAGLFDQPTCELFETLLRCFQEHNVCATNRQETCDSLSKSHPECKLPQCGNSAAAEQWNERVRYRLSLLNNQTDPCDDFYEYSCGNWLNNAPPTSPTNVMHDPFNGTAFQRKQLTFLISSGFPIITDFAYACYLHTDEKPASNDTTLKKLFQHITNVKSVEDNEFPKLLGLLSAVSPNPTAPIYVSMNRLRLYPKRRMDRYNIYTVPTGGVYVGKGKTIYKPKVYCSSADDMKKVQQIVKDGFENMGMDTFHATVTAVNVIDLECKLETATDATVLDLYVFDMHNLTASAPYFNFTQFFKSWGVDPSTITPHPPLYVPIRYFKSWFDTLKAADINTVHQMLKYRVYTDLWHNLRYGYSSKTSRSACFSLMGRLYADLMAQILNPRFTTEYSKQTARTVIEYVLKGYNKTITESTWMDKDTIDKALQKLNDITMLLGGPYNQLRRSYSDVQVDKHKLTDSYIALQSVWLTSEQKRLSHSLNRSDWISTYETTNIAMDGLAQNAEYTPKYNSIAVMAAYLHSLDILSPWTVQFGSFGFTVGHEIGHAFDPQGRHWFIDGDNVDWWSAASEQNFLNKSQCTADAYSNLHVKDGVHHVNGKRTLGENIADNFGLHAAFAGWQQFVVDKQLEGEVMNGISSDKLFFISAAQLWCRKVDKSFEEELWKDVHTPYPQRVNGLLMNTKKFAEVFQCKSGSPMNPEKKCEWS